MPAWTKTGRIVGPIPEPSANLYSNNSFRFPTRKEADRANQRHLDNLPGPARSYRAIDSGDTSNGLPLDRLTLQSRLKSRPDPELHFRIHAQIMLLYNADVPAGLVNGTCGFIDAFITKKENKERPVPHKVIGSTFKADKALYPLLKLFPKVDSGDPVYRLCLPITFEEPDPDDLDRVGARRTQLPLTLSWAFTIHKAPAQTIPYMQVDLKKAFASGQAYVALSRIQSPKEVRVLNFSRNAIIICPFSIEFFRRIYRDTI